MGLFCDSIHGQSAFQFNLIQFERLFCIFCKTNSHRTPAFNAESEKHTLYLCAARFAVFGFDSVLALRFLDVDNVDSTRLKGMKSNQDSFLSLSHAMPMRFRLQNFRFQSSMSFSEQSLLETAGDSGKPCLHPVHDLVHCLQPPATLQVFGFGQDHLIETKNYD